MSDYVDEIDKIGLMVELADSKCELDHEGDRERPADNWIGVPVGGNTMWVPICNECALELEKKGESTYLLFYCLNCMSSRWALKDFLRNKYEDSIEFLFECPKCSDKH